MIQGSRSIVAIVPVRGGSIGVPRKNLRLLAGKPLLWHIVNALTRASLVNMVIISTEDDEIAEVSSSYGVDVFRHPRALSEGGKPAFGVIKWVVKQLSKAAVDPRVCLLARATSPLCTEEDIDSAINLYMGSKPADSVVSVRRAAGLHPTKLKVLSADGRLLEKFGCEGNVPVRRQELEPLYIRNEAIYVSTPTLIARDKLWGDNCYGYVMPEERSININTEIDFRIADMLLRERKMA